MLFLLAFSVLARSQCSVCEEAATQVCQKEANAYCDGNAGVGQFNLYSAPSKNDQSQFFLCDTLSDLWCIQNMCIKLTAAKDADCCADYTGALNTCGVQPNSFTDVFCKYPYHCLHANVTATGKCELGTPAPLFLDAGSSCDPLSTTQYCGGNNLQCDATNTCKNPNFPCEDDLDCPYSQYCKFPNPPSFNSSDNMCAPSVADGERCMQGGRECPLYSLCVWDNPRDSSRGGTCMEPFSLDAGKSCSPGASECKKGLFCNPTGAGSVGFCDTPKQFCDCQYSSAGDSCGRGMTCGCAPSILRLGGVYACQFDGNVQSAQQAYYQWTEGKEFRDCVISKSSQLTSSDAVKIQDCYKSITAAFPDDKVPVGTDEPMCPAKFNAMGVTYKHASDAHRFGPASIVLVLVAVVSAWL